METNVDRLGVDDLLEIISDRVAVGIGDGSGEQARDWLKADTYIRRLKLIAEKYKIDERRIR